MIKEFVYIITSAKKITTPVPANQWKYGTVTSLACAQHKIWIGNENYGVLVIDSATHQISSVGITSEKQVSDVLADDFENIGTLENITASVEFMDSTSLYIHYLPPSCLIVFTPF